MKANRTVVTKEGTSQTEQIIEGYRRKIPSPDGKLPWQWLTWPGGIILIRDVENDFSVLWKWHKSRLLPSCLRILLYLDHDAYSCWRHLVAMRRLWGPSQGMKEAKAVCLWAGRGTIFCENLLPQAWIDMGRLLLAAEHLSKAVLKIQPRFISSRVSTTWWCFLLV